MSVSSQSESKVRGKPSVAAPLVLVLLVPLGFCALQARVDLFSEPANLEQVFTSVSRATFEIKCDTEWTGAGWGHLLMSHPSHRV